MNRISEQASRWAIRCDAGALDPDEQHELDAWLDADPRHRGAYVRARAQWVDLDRLAAIHGPAAIVPQARTWGRNISRRQVLAAGMATFAVGGLCWSLLSARERYTSGVGEIRRITLIDGSTVLLNTQTDIVVEFTDRQRNLHLLRGEALFEVAHDATRPFVVATREAAVRAVGTAFAVRVEASQVEVTVTEGVVEVSPRTSVVGADPASNPVEASQQVKINERVTVAGARTSPVMAIPAADADRRLAWRGGMVSFDGETLQSAVTEINRYNRRRIVIDDVALAAMPVVGVFRANDLDSFSAAAASALKARAVADGDVIRLTRSDGR